MNQRGFLKRGSAFLTAWDFLLSPYPFDQDQASPWQWFLTCLWRMNLFGQLVTASVLVPGKCSYGLTIIQFHRPQKLNQGCQCKNPCSKRQLGHLSICPSIPPSNQQLMLNAEVAHCVLLVLPGSAVPRQFYPLGAQVLRTRIRKSTISLGDTEAHPSFYKLWQKTEKNARPFKRRVEQFLANQECRQPTS